MPLNDRLDDGWIGKAALRVTSLHTHLYAAGVRLEVLGRILGGDAALDDVTTHAPRYGRCLAGSSWPDPRW